MSYTASQKYLLRKIFLFKFATSSLYCLQEPPENNNSDSQHLTRPYFLDPVGARCYSDAVISPRKRQDLETKSQKLY